MLIDVLVILILVLALVGGLRAGLFSSLGSLGGILVAVLALPWALPPVLDLVSDPTWKWVTGASVIVVLLLVCSSVGSSLGSLLRRGADKLRLRVPERILGAVASTAVAAVVLSLVATGVSSAGIPGLSSAVSSSAALRAVDRVLPDRWQEAGDRVRTALFDQPLLPAVPGPSSPAPADPADPATPVPGDAPAVDPSSPALVTASESVARISGIATACRTMPTGSGFVAADNRVVTNAHVVAGVDAPVVTLPDGRAADGRVVYFNEDDDVAVIAVDIDARPLPVASGVGVGESGVVQGYPGGGPFRSVPADVLSAGPAQFGTPGSTSSFRSILQLRTEVVPGNSGGPFLTSAGEVGGVVFARDERNASTGYAVTVDALDRASAAYAPDAPPVPTGQCSTGSTDSAA